MLYNNVYELNLDQLVVDLLPTRLRKAKQVAWLQSLITPFKKELQIIKQDRTSTIYRLQHGYTVGSIEKVLNDAFDSIERRIRLMDGTYLVPAIIYTAGENKPVDTEFISYTPQELVESSGDFIVNIPAELNLQPTDIIRLQALTRQYCLEDKAFKIEMI